jgi:hypothetical protein
VSDKTAEERERAERERENNLYEKRYNEWDDGDLSWVLHRRYTPTPVPPCCVCGGKLSMQSIGGGRPTGYACVGRDDDGNWLEGRSVADYHYTLSCWDDHGHGGDGAVMELVRRYGVEKAERDSLAKQFVDATAIEGAAQLRADKAERALVACEAVAEAARAWVNAKRYDRNVFGAACNLVQALDDYDSTKGGE